MVRAILDGTKTQTRRVVRPAPMMVTDNPMVSWAGDAKLLLRQLQQIGRNCPYGQPGDRLWVREAWHADHQYDSLPPRDIPAGFAVLWAADKRVCKFPLMTPGKLRPSMFMRRLASRLLLEITDVRIERLQDINEADAQAEGARECDPVSGREVLLAGRSQRGSHVLHYREIWNEINGAGSWDANPWVWAMSFRRLP